MKRKVLTTAAAAAAALVMVGAPAAFATSDGYTHVTIDGSLTSPGGWVGLSGTNDGTLNFETDFSTPVPMSCTVADVSGRILQDTSASGQVKAGNTIGYIDSLTFDNCDATDLHYDVKVTELNGPWPIVVKTTPTVAGSNVAVTIQGVSAYMHSDLPAPTPGNPATKWPCELIATSTGVDATVIPGVVGGHDGRIEIDTTGNYPLALQAADGWGTKTPTGSGTCGGQVYTGDNADMTGDFNVDVDPGNPGDNPISHAFLP